MKDKTEQRRMLTEKQEQFLAEHHYLVEDFLKYRGLPMDEFLRCGDIQIYACGKAI